MPQQMAFNVVKNGFLMSPKNELFEYREEIGFLTSQKWDF